MRFSVSSILILPAVATLVVGLNIPRPDLLAFARDDGGANNSSSSTSASSQVASGSATVTSSIASSTSTSSAGGGNDPQSSLTLDPNVIAKGFENDGQNQPAAGQVASLTSSNNFINFCLTVPNLPLTNGQQISSGSCNPAPMGVIPSTANMPSAKFTNPKNLDTIPANQAFTVSLAIQGMQTGFFTNAQENYFAAPQQLNNQGQIQGHSHIVIEQLDSLTQTTPTDPTKFAFFKGLNNAAQNGVLTADVSNGLPDGTYKISTINTASNHQPVLVPVAQHGSLDDAVYFTVGNGKNGGNNGGNGGNNGGNNGNSKGNLNGNVSSDRRRFLSRMGIGLH